MRTESREQEKNCTEENDYQSIQKLYPRSASLYLYLLD